MNSEKIKLRIKKAIKKRPTKVNVFSPRKNKYKGNNSELDYMFSTEGLFTINGTSKTVTTDTGIIVKPPNINLMLVVDDEVKCIEKGDFFKIGEKKYEVKAIDDLDGLNICFSYLLEEV